MSPQLIKWNIRLKNLCKIKSKVVKKVLKLPKGDLQIAKIHSLSYTELRWTAHTSKSWSKQKLSIFKEMNFMINEVKMHIPVSPTTLMTFDQITLHHFPEANNLQLLYISMQ